MEEVLQTTLGLLDDIQNEFTFIAKNFRTTDGSGEVALYISEELKRNFGVGLLDKSIGETVTGMGQTAEALFYDPFGTVASVAYAMTVGRVVDVGRGIKFAFDTAWGNGTARSDVEQFVEEQKKQVDENGLGYYSGSVMGQVLAYAFVGKAFRSVENKHSDLGGSGGGKPESGKGTDAYIGSIVKDGNKTKYTNPAGNQLTWVDQHPKNISRDIKSFVDSPNIGKATEGKVAKLVSEQKEVIGFGQKVQREDKTPAGDFDVLTKDEIIEVKASAGALKVDQIEKYTNVDHKDFLNSENRKVIVYIEEPLINLAPEQLQKLNKIKDMGAIIVNSDEELRGVLK
ncbi:hypothetical protein [Paenibacillus sp. ALJ109b]|uniref:hypothetical protein n=1 Tax=Paenibacillus sp. ALJ109b TaxID=2709068 RepID=UPI001F0796C0|nr:hypothetical protein [Paenibacillus sp. ALJ109b]